MSEGAKGGVLGGGVIVVGVRVVKEKELGGAEGIDVVVVGAAEAEAGEESKR